MDFGCFLNTSIACQAWLGAKADIETWKGQSCTAQWTQVIGTFDMSNLYCGKLYYWGKGDRTFCFGFLVERVFNQDRCKFTSDSSVWRSWWIWWRNWDCFENRSTVSSISGGEPATWIRVQKRSSENLKIENNLMMNILWQVPEGRHHSRRGLVSREARGRREAGPKPQDFRIPTKLTT